ncbi:hypothetical protein [Allosphingosinicella humi]
MALTPEEAAELRRLKAEEQAAQELSQGDLAVSSALNHRKPIQYGPLSGLRAFTRDFSLYRATVGALRDAAQGVIEAVDDVGDFLGRKTGVGGLVFGGAAENGLVQYLDYNELNRRGGDVIFGTSDASPKLPEPEGSEHAGAAERIARGIGAFMVPYTAAAKTLGVMRGASWLGRAGRAMAAGAAADLVQVDPVSGNMANVLRDTFGIQSDTLDALASEEDDDALYTRLKAAVVNAPIGLAADALLETGFRAVKAYRAWRGTAEEAEATVRSMQDDMGLDPAARRLPALLNPGSEDLARTGGVSPGVEAPSGRAKKADEAYDPLKHVRPEKPPQDFEDVLDYLKDQAGTELDEEALARLADNLLWGSPENALAKLGIDPAKLDFSKFDDPDMLGRLHKGLAEVYETIAAKLGRSNIRVTEAATLRAARAFGTTSDVLKRVHGATENLAEYLTASRLFVGAHAHKLLALGDEALDEIIANGAGPKWAEFMQAFHRHAYYLGTLRGAGSEVGRALRSLQIIGRVGKKAAGRRMEKALQSEASQLPMAIRQDAETYLSGLMTDAEKIEAISRLKSLEGDVGELAVHVRAKNMSILHRVDDALRETIGNLFSAGTASLNVLSGGLMLGVRGLSKGLAAVSRMALSPLGAKHSMAARIHLMETWAYTDGIISGFREAFDNAISVFQKEGMAEAAVNLDGMGLHVLAKEASALSAKGDAAMSRGNFERTEVRNHRAFAITPEEQNLLRKIIEREEGPSFFTNALYGLTKLLVAPINAAGTLSRLGTTIFINMPDQFVGTLAARAGARAEAVRLAAAEAAELGLEGKPLSDYLKARTVQLSADVDGWHPDAFDAGAREAMARHGDAEAREVLFQDQLEVFGPVARLGNAPLLHMVVPFIKTPLRILERTAIDFTPLGLIKAAHRKAILAGGPQADEARARLALGLIAMGTAFQLADDRIVVGHDGSFRSSARVAGRPSYSLKIGDDAVEFSRLDPLGILLGFGADMRDYLDHAEDDPEAQSGIMLAGEAMLWSIASNMLSKTWLTSLRNLVEIASAGDDERTLSQVSKMIGTLAVRAVPGSGFQRQVEKADDGMIREADTFIDNWLKNSLGADVLPIKRDHLLGRPVPVRGLDRLIGVRVAPGTDKRDDPLLAELENLSFDFPAAKRTIEGVRLNAAQFSRWLELKGQVVRNEDTGLTLEETLRVLVSLPEYQSRTRAGRVDAIRKEMEGFGRLASKQLIREDEELAYRVLRMETFSKLELMGATRPEKDAALQRLAAELDLVAHE